MTMVKTLHKDSIIQMSKIHSVNKYTLNYDDYHQRQTMSSKRWELYYFRWIIGKDESIGNL